MNTKIEIAQLHVTIGKAKTLQFLTVNADSVSDGILTFKNGHQCPVTTMRPAPSKSVFVPTDAQIERMNEASCDASFNEITGQMEFSAR